MTDPTVPQAIALEIHAQVMNGGFALAMDGRIDSHDLSYLDDAACRLAGDDRKLVKGFIALVELAHRNRRYSRILEGFDDVYYGMVASQFEAVYDALGAVE